jgi:hypothetical protein
MNTNMNTNMNMNMNMNINMNTGKKPSQLHPTGSNGLP